MAIFLILILFFSIIIHEYSHGLVAYKLGDPTAKFSGRLTLNPIAHIDIFGTIILPLFLLVIGAYPFGYAKPVPINPYNFRNPKKDIMWVGMAGPLSNIILATVFIAIIKLNIVSDLFYMVFVYGFIINLILALFNLLPIPPLDGSRIVIAFLSYKQAYHYQKFEKYGFILILVLFFSGILHRIILPFIGFVLFLFKINLPL